MSQNHQRYLSPTLCIFLVTAAVAFATPLIDPSEARFALIAQISSGNGSTLNPMFYDNNNNLVHYYSKPPLFVWLVMFFQLFLPLELAQRAPSLLTGIAYVCISQRILNSAGENFRYKFLEYIFQYPAFIVFLVIGIIDPLFSFLVFFSVVTWIYWRNYWISGALCGLSVLSKGPVGVVITFPVVLLVSFFNKEREIYGLILDSMKFLLSMTVVAGWWFVYVSLTDPDFFQYFLVNENIGRFFGSSKIRYGTLHKEPLGLAIIASLVFLLPQPIRTIQAIRTALFSIAESAFDKVAKGLAILSVWTVGLFSLSRTFLVSYLMPLTLAIPLIGLSKDRKSNKYRGFFISISIVFYCAVCLYYILYFNLNQFYVPLIVGIFVFTKASRELWLSFVTLGGFMIVAPLRSNFDLRDYRESNHCDIVYHFHPRHHTAQLYFPGNLERTTRRVFSDGECILVEDDDIYDNSLEIVFKGRLLSVAKVHGQYVVK